MAKITFIGTGGGRFATIFQKRATGGIYIADKGLLMHVDPGPGALVRALDLDIDPTQTDVIFVSHAHPDHYNDAEILVEAMTLGGKNKRGMLIGSESVINGTHDYRALSAYHKKIAKEVKVVQPGDTILLKDWYEMHITPALHSDESTVGFQLKLEHGAVSYTSDTQLFDGLVEAHKGARVLIACLTRPLNGKIPFHMSAEEVAELVKAVEPELAILTHLGLKVIVDVNNQANWITKESGVPTIAAFDGMRLYLDEKIEIKKD
ncbi:MAG: MBL fold metallo-hydrolase [Thermoplasmata archaeon]|nr:MAG: MBL fold metallo-hydrolase [Thermoplasmata archaeon]HDN50539.1 MBL fold metallo-hydrolase [Thermoplasmatales archaeon]